MPTLAQSYRGLRVILFSLATGVALFLAGAVVWLGIVSAAPRPKPAADADKDKMAVDNLQRSLQLDTYRIDGDSGAARGEVIYAYKCWMCHNKYTKSAPYLAVLYKRPSLGSGSPRSAENVAAKIKEGDPLMPSSAHNSSDSDIADLVPY